MEDFLLDDTGDLLIKNGDFVQGNADEQTIMLLLATEKGSIKQDVLAGFGLVNYIDAEFTPILRTALERELQIQLEYDGFQVENLETQCLDELKIEGHYPKKIQKIEQI